MKVSLFMSCRFVKINQHFKIMHCCSRHSNFDSFLRTDITSKRDLSTWLCWVSVQCLYVVCTYSRYITLVHPWIELKQGVYRDFEFSGLVLIDICACLDKGHLTSEGNFCVSKSSKKRPNFLKDFCSRGQIKKNKGTLL